MELRSWAALVKTVAEWCERTGVSVLIAEDHRNLLFGFCPETWDTSSEDKPIPIWQTKARRGRPVCLIYPGPNMKHRMAVAKMISTPEGRAAVAAHVPTCGACAVDDVHSS